MRPIYETDDDRAREATVRQYLLDHYHCQYRTFDRLSVLDGMLLHPDGTPAAVVEIKTRKTPSGKYGTYMLSANKWRGGLELAKTYGVVFLLVVQFTDGMFVTKMRDKYELGIGGRYDRKDSKDIEECIYIPMEQFKSI